MNYTFIGGRKLVGRPILAGRTRWKMGRQPERLPHGAADRLVGQAVLPPVCSFALGLVVQEKRQAARPPAPLNSALPRNPGFTSATGTRAMVDAL